MYYSVDLSPGHNLSDNSEELLGRGKRGARIYRSFCKKQTNKQKNPKTTTKKNPKTQVVEHQKIPAN